MISEKLKSIIFDKLYQDLKHCEIISYDKSVYFIDRDNKYWYFEYEKGGTLWWRYTFFNVFFQLFSITYKEFQPVLGEWVEEVLNCKVLTTFRRFQQNRYVVEEVLNCKVLTTVSSFITGGVTVEEVLNCKVLTTELFETFEINLVEEVLNCKVLTIPSLLLKPEMLVEEALNCKVLTTIFVSGEKRILVEKVLNHKALNYLDFDGTRPYKMEETLNCKVLTTKGTPYLEKHLEDVLKYNESKT